jgi:dTDP-glucose 4,6-dehydratase
MQTILVTGGAGFIGANFVLDWVRGGHGRVVNLDKLTYAGHAASLSPLEGDARHVLVRGDIADQSLVASLLRQYRPSAVINFAAESHVDRSISGPSDFIQTNIVGVFQLLEAAREYWLGLPGDARDCFRFLQISTDEVFGTLSPLDPPFRETMPFAPNSPYSASKAAADHLVRAWHHTYGLPVLTTHCSNNYGPLQFPEKLIPLVLLQALEGKPLPVYGDGLQVRDWLYVSDHCAALRAVLARGEPGATYNIGGHNEMTNLDVVRRICALLDEWRPREDGRPYAEQITFVQDRPGHDRRYAIDAAKLAGELGWTPLESFDGGIRKTVRWYLDHPEWIAAVRSRRYS